MTSDIGKSLKTVCGHVTIDKALKMVFVDLTNSHFFTCMIKCCHTL